MPRAIHYNFIQNFNVSARQAFAWCTNYTPEDMALMQEVNATREVQHIITDTILLVDTFVNTEKTVVKHKLVCLHPERLMWTATHLTGPNVYSQFLYEIIPQSNEKSCLKFTGLQLDYAAKDADVESLSEKLRRVDSEKWKLLAREMEKEFGDR